jgi:hypothetical protein
MSETNDLVQLHIEALRVLARTNQSNRGLLIEKNINDYLTVAGSERSSLERLCDAIDHEEAEKHQGEDWSIVKDYVRARLSWLA